MTDIVKNQLQHILNQSNINHSVEILKEESVKNAHIYCKINQLSGQVTGPLIESYLKEKYNMTKNLYPLGHIILRKMRIFASRKNFLMLLL